jgi:uncharacterized protein YkwD
MMGFSRYCVLVLLFVFGFSLPLSSFAQSKRATSKILPPAISLRSLENAQVALLLSKVDHRVVKISVQRRNIGSAFRSLTTLRIPRTSSDSVSLSDESAPSGEVLYRARAQSKGGEWSKWSKTLRVKVDFSNEPLRPGPPKLSLCNNQQLEEALNLTNEIRAQSGAAPLVINSSLVVAAQSHSNLMAKNQNLTHDGWSKTILEAGYQGAGMAQNIAQGFPTVQSTLAAWLDSTGHRENLLYSKWTETGFGCTVDGFGRMWWTQNFGRS